MVNLGWNESAIGIALSLMGFTALIVQTYAGDIIDKTAMDRRQLLAVASLMTACSAMAVLFVRKGNEDHILMYITKIMEGIASSFIGPCLAALTLASFGPDKFDHIMASNVLWGHIGSSASAVLAGAAAYFLYPNIKYCFFVIGFAALFAILFTQFLPQGDRLMGRGFHGTSQEADDTINQLSDDLESRRVTPSEAASYLSVLFEPKTLVLCITGFFYQ